MLSSYISAHQFGVRSTPNCTLGIFWRGLFCLLHRATNRYDPSIVESNESKHFAFHRVYRLYLFILFLCLFLFWLQKVYNLFVCLQLTHFMQFIHTQKNNRLHQQYLILHIQTLYTKHYLTCYNK